MTLLGFNIGSAPAPAASAVDMSLDDMIASRRKQAKPGGAASIPKKVSNADRSIATARAKRSAAMAARRGLSATPKATKMEIEQEVTKQAGKTAIKKARQQQQVTKGGGAGATPNQRASGIARAQQRRQQRNVRNDAKQAAAAVSSGTRTTKAGKPAAIVAVTRPPPKKAITAAVNAMEKTGYHIPEGMQMVISFAPVAGDAKSRPPPKSPPKGKGTFSTQSTKGGGDPARRGRGGGR